MTYEEHLIKLSFYYANEYQKDGRNFLNTYRKYKSIRTVCQEIIRAYKSEGAYQEMDQENTNFKPYAYKYYEGKEAQNLADILLIIYNLTK
jgi:hypothetical protein